MKFFSSTRYTPQQLQNIAIDLFCDVLGSILPQSASIPLQSSQASRLAVSPASP